MGCEAGAETGRLDGCFGPKGVGAHHIPERSVAFAARQVDGPEVGHRFASYSFFHANVTGFTESLYLSISTVSRSQTRTASHAQEESMSRISRIAQLIPQVLRATLR